MAVAGEVILAVRAEGVEQAQAQLARLGETVRSVGSLAGDVLSLGVAFTAFGATLASITRLGFASEMQALRGQLESLTGSAQLAETALQGILDTALATRFDTAQVAQFAAIMMGLGLSVEEVNSEMRALLDLMAAMGVRRADFERVAFNLLQIRQGVATMADIRQLVAAMPGVGMALAREMGRDTPLTMEEMSALARQDSQAFFDLLLRAARNFEGASARLGIADVLANLGDTISIVMIPSAELLATVLQGLIRVLTPAIELFGRLNRALYGVPGLLIALAAATVAATSALRALSVVGLFSGLSGLVGMLRGLAGLRGVLSLLIGLGARLVGLGTAIGRVVLALGRLAGIAGLIGLALELIGRFVSGTNTQLGEELRTLGLGVGLGALVGGIIGSLLPGIGNLIGSLIGGAIGAIVGLVQILLGRRATDPQTQSAQQQTARNTSQMVRQLESLRVQLVGGRDRARAALSRYEVEAYLRELAYNGI